MVKSTFLSLSKNDYVKGLVMAVLGAVTGGVYNAVAAGTVISVAVLKSAAGTGVLAGLSYLIKNVFTNSNDEFMKPEVK